MTDASATVPDVAALRDRVLATFADHVGRGARVALVDFPNHPNGGDTAIWLGERAALRHLDAEVAYVASAASFSSAVMRRRLGAGGVLLLHGGGNFGDVWPTFQRFRERVVAEHRDRRVVQLPQSLQYSDPAAIDRTNEVYGRHPDLRLLLRDAPSEALAREHFPRATVRACPDAAFALGPLRPPAPDVPILVFARTDHEKRHAPPAASAQVAVADWPAQTDRLGRMKELSRLLGFPLKRVGGWAEPLDDPLRRLFTALAHERMRQGLDVLGRGQVVVTDRLHGHILSLLLGRPHVLLDNSYGKNRRFYDRWTAGHPLVSWADSLDEAMERARALAG